MNIMAMKGIWKKEWLMMRGYYLTAMTFNILWLVFAPTIMGNSPYLSTPTALILIHLFYMSGLLIYSFNREADHMEQTLHSPLSGYHIAGVKIFQSFIFFTASLLLVILVGMVSARYETILTLPQIFTAFSQLALFVIGIAISLAIILFFLWSLHQVMKKYIGGFSVVICIVLFFCIAAFLTWIQDTAFYQALLSVGPVFFDQEISTTQGNISFDIGTGPITLGKVFFFFMLNALLILSGMTIFDRKVEV
ncbi:hypothetical protein LCM20_07980 [Halobacillus litoralis]|uniref:hypothetical protein n=1 Tax=Halobacillus litoralis TaxID=45668 RepID=UPI001CD2EEB3|nr:hypothetical protein [Halobacillus litoralis]MCA0970520.1 hypothetical protein [Halobacillus litoralis]